MDKAQARLEMEHLEGGRWWILEGCRNGGELGLSENRLLSILRSDYPTTTADWIRQELIYLEGKGLLVVEKHGIKPWQATLTSAGRDVVDRIVAPPAGIVAPPKFW